MNTATTADAVDRYLGLDEQTAAFVAAAFGSDPTQTRVDGPVDLERLDAVIDAITAGQAQATAAVATAMTPAEQQAPELPADPPVDTSHLRRRIGAMDEQARALFLAAWQASGLPTVLAGGDGSSVILSAEAHAGVEQLIAAHEPAADPNLHLALSETIRSMAGGPRFVVIDRCRLHGIADVYRADTMTTGRLNTVSHIVTDVRSEATEEVAAALGPVQQGQVVTEPVADAEALATVPPDGKVADVLAWVADVPERAALALNAEERKAKPRASLVAKLAQIAGVAVPPTADAAPAPAADSDGGLASPVDESAATLAGLALADRLVGVADELYAIATAIVEGQAVS